ncbi:MAG: hypothetical protein K6T55_12235, partial [Syntrophobacterales bacterium]|nr:hypothetical protein [Syntrophobacterales bacterium]
IVSECKEKKRIMICTNEKNRASVKGIKKAGFIEIAKMKIVVICGIKIKNVDQTIQYLKNRIMNKKILIKDETFDRRHNKHLACIYLPNKIFVNRYLIQAGLAVPDGDGEHM